MKKINISLLALVFTLSFVIVSCSSDKKEEGDKKEKTEATENDEATQDVNCLDIVKNYKDLSEDLINLVTSLKENQDLATTNYMELMQKAEDLEIEIQKMGQDKLGETCWQDFLEVQIRLTEALAKAMVNFSEGDATGVMLDNLKNLNDAANTINKVKEITNN